MDSNFFKELLLNYDIDKVELYIASNKSRIIASNNPTRIGDIGQTAKHVLSVGRAISMPVSSGDAQLVRYGVPVMSGTEIVYVIVVRGYYEEATKIGLQLSQHIDAAYKYHSYLQKKDKPRQNINDEIAQTILKSDFNLEATTSLMLENEYNPYLLRSVILINLHFHKNKYFNVNLGLGYESSIEQSRKELLEKLKKNRYINAQDIVYTPNRHTYIILKSFIDSTEKSQIYKALTVICNEFKNLLKNDNAYYFSIAHGDVYEGIDRLHSSLAEATDIIDLGEKIEVNRVQRIQDLLLEYTSMNMPESIENQMIKPYIDILLNEQDDFSLLFTVAIYIDHGMNLSKTAELLEIHRNTANARVIKFQNITGLDPSTFFKDAFIVKMIELYVRRNYGNE